MARLSCELHKRLRAKTKPFSVDIDTYRVTRGNTAERRRVRSLFPEISELPRRYAELAVTAWITSWRSSKFADLATAPFDVDAPEYGLVQHVKDVTVCGKLLARIALQQWGTKARNDVLLSVLLLHDVDKLLLYVPLNTGPISSPTSKVFPHGVLGAMLLHEVGFPDTVTGIVGTHAQSSPFHGADVEAWILHYADCFAADHALRSGESTPIYQRH